MPAFFPEQKAPKNLKQIFVPRSFIVAYKICENLLFTVRINVYNNAQKARGRSVARDRELVKHKVKAYFEIDE